MTTDAGAIGRLCLATLGAVPVASRPPFDPAALGTGIVHLGIGAFHRAHQAVYTQGAIAATGDERWGICGVTQRSAAVVDQLAPQDGLYTVLQRGRWDSDAAVIGSVRDVVFAGDPRSDIGSLIAAPRTQIVTVTVTEKGYRHDPATGKLRQDDAAIAADLSGGDPTTTVGQIVRGLQLRRKADAGPLSVASCDNLPSNGRILRGLVLEFCERLPAGQREGLAQWVGAHVSFPCTMVDRIVPATTTEDRAEVSAAIGLRDEGVVVAEPFSQWVLEDAFAGERPAWELAGATLTADVAPYEAMKLRLLNGGHSCLAYLGALAGHRYISDVMVAPDFADFVVGYLDDDATPDLHVPTDFDLAAYKQALVARWSNASLRHSTRQVAMDGSHKLPQRLLAVIRERLAAGAEPAHACLAVAAWMRYVTTATTDDGRPIAVDDPLAERFAQIGASHPPAVLVDEMLRVHEVFGDDLSDDATFRRLLTDALVVLQTAGATAAVRDVARRTAHSPEV